MRASLRRASYGSSSQGGSILVRSLAAAAVLLAVCTPAAVQELDLRAQVAAFVAVVERLDAQLSR
ncbi:hypothetical protein [Brevundimonas sp.]|uniref:hypothetical protein n=1 Tax=Brevundimonas sp. TaxID=1871086 RepID=UPI00272F6DB6|nr:hypothetical protein [Brevundimonas sp.]MDP1912056.1 hypothetical protein [Brevundimonas sp.]